jgi:hypothetical protein
LLIFIIIILLDSYYLITIFALFHIISILPSFSYHSRYHLFYPMILIMFIVNLYSIILYSIPISSHFYIYPLSNSHKSSIMLIYLTYLISNSILFSLSITSHGLSSSNFILFINLLYMKIALLTNLLLSLHSMILLNITLYIVIISQ